VSTSSSVCLSRASDVDQRATLPIRSAESPIATPLEPRGRPTRAALPVIQGYEFARPLGRGGMGVVYLAREVALNRWVAVKLLVGGSFAGDEAIERFRREAEAVAALQHPNIIQIFQVGTSEFGPDGQPACPFIVLEYADGGTLAAHTGKPADPRVAAELIATLADAVHYAHSRGIVHRDLKPGNVLMRVHAPSDRPAAGLHGMLTPKISDFGLAKRFGNEAEASTATIAGSMLGTPEYMAPEQANGRSDVGPSADVYALGVILYELLTGRVPLQGADYVDTLWRVRMQEPVPAARLQPRVPRDLDTICECCLRKDPGRRYASAAALAADLRAWRDGRPISARPSGAAERAWKWARRRPSVAALLAAVLIVTLAGIVGVLGQWREAERRALTERAAHERAGQALEAAETSIYFGRINIAQRELAAGNRWDAERILDDCRPAAGGRDLRGWEWHYLKNACRGEVLTLQAADSWIWDIAFSPDGALIATAAGSPYDDERAAQPGELTIWEAATGRRVRSFRGHQGSLRLVAFSPDGRWIAAAGFDRLLHVWHVATGEAACPAAAVFVEVRPDPDNFGHCGPFWFTADSRGIDFRGPECWHRLEIATGRVAPLAGRDGLIDVTSDGCCGLARRGDTDLEVIDLATGAAIDRLRHPKSFYRAALSPDRGQVITADERNVEMFNLRPQSRDELAQADSWVEVVKYSPDGQWVAWAGSSRQVVVRNRCDGRITTYVGHDAEVRGVAFSPDGRHIASCDRTGRVFIWDLTRSPLVQTYRPGLDASNQLAVWLSADGSTAYSAFHDGRFFYFDVAGSHELAGGLRGLTRRVEFPRMDIRAGANGKVVFGPLEAERSVVAQWDVAKGEVVREYRGHRYPVVSTAVSRDGRRLATRAALRKAKQGEHETWVWDVSTGEMLRAISTEALVSLALSSDGGRLAAFLRTGEVASWDVATGRELWRRAGHSPVEAARASSAVFDLAYSPDDRLIATAGFFDGCVQLLNAATGEPVHGPLAARPALTGVAFTPDGRRVAAAGYDSEVRLWDVATGRLALTLTVPGGARRADLGFTARPYFSQRGGRLGVLNWNGLIAVWNGDAEHPDPK